MIQDLLKGKIIPFEKQIEIFQEASRSYNKENGPFPVWHPNQQTIKEANVSRLMTELQLESYDELHQWSVKNRGQFWKKVLQLLNILFKKEPDQILDDSKGVIHPKWLPGAEFNCVDSCFSTNPEKPAIVSGTEDSDNVEVMTYGELNELVNRIANGLQDQGFRHGDRIALYMPMTSLCIAAYLAIVKAGCCAVSIADSFSTEEVKKRIEISQTKAIITTTKSIRAGKTIPIYEKIKGIVPAIVIGADSTQELDPNDTNWTNFLSDKRNFNSVTAKGTGYTNILFSSGTTNEPKAIPWNHITPIKCAMDGYFHQDIHPEDVVMWPTNIGWMMGPWLIYASFINQATISLYEGAPYQSGFLEFVKRSNTTILGVVPSLVKTWRNSGLLSTGNWEQIRLFSSTGEPSNCEDYLWLMSLTNYRAPVIEYLGGTEIGGGHITASVMQPSSPSYFTTPALGINCTILNDKGEEIQEGETGELYLIPPALGLSQELLNMDHNEIYYHDCPSGPNGETLRRHGDQIARLPGGFYQARGRTDDTMNIGGIKISSVELEEVINQHEKVYESAVVSVTQKGQSSISTVAFVVLDTPCSKEIMKEELNRILAQQLNPLFKIHQVIVIRKLPRTASNKLMRRELRAQYMQDWSTNE
jgi:acetyl-CoA synthetase